MGEAAIHSSVVSATERQPGRLLWDGTTARSVPLAIRQAATGDGTIMRVGLTRTLGISADIASGMMVSIIRSEEPAKIARGDIGRSAAGTFFGDAQVKTIVPTCAKWASGTLPANYDQPVKAAAPTPLLSKVSTHAFSRCSANPSLFHSSPGARIAPLAHI